MSPTERQTHDLEHAPSRANDVRGGLETYEMDRPDKPPFYLTKAEVKLLGISGVGFFLDAYDLFIINQVTAMLSPLLYGGKELPAGLHGIVNASANIGSVVGQFLFGYLADAFGRKAIYGKELMIIIFATIMTIAAPTGPFMRAGNPDNVLIWLIVWRIVLGVGVGADYPMSASVSSDRVSTRKRGTMLAYVFANQGWGSFVGCIVTIVTLACYKHVMDTEGKVSKVDGVWRIVVGISLIPAFGTLYQRLTLPEAKRYKESRDIVDQIRKEKEAAANAVTVKQNVSDLSEKKTQSTDDSTNTATDGSDESIPVKELTLKKKQHFQEFFKYYSEWRHARILIGTCLCWFLLDIAFYGINLNQSVVLQQIGFGGSSGTVWHKLFETAVGNLIITALGFVPGYYVTVLTVEILGRKWIQVQGFLMAALFLGILAGKFHTLSTAGFCVCFAFLQFFFNFGANATTYLYPAEVFPTRFRATAHGLSAASGKAGAIISSLGFNALTKRIGTSNVLWIFFGVCWLGAATTFLLPEVKGRDPDLVEREELMEDNSRRHAD